MTPGITSELTLGDLAASRHATIERRGCVVHYWIGGPEDAPPVVLCHAALTDHSLFATMIPALGSSYRILSWDIRGHGRSRPLQGKFSVSDAVDDLIAIVRANGVERAAIVGQGMGSSIAQLVTLRHPGLIEALVVIGGRCIAVERGASSPTISGGAGLMKVGPFEALKRQSVMASAERQSSRDHLSRMLAPLTKHEYLKIMDGVSRCGDVDTGCTTAVPTLLIRGELDPDRRLDESLSGWAMRQPSAVYHVIEGAGHCASLDRPDAVNDLVVDFLLGYRMARQVTEPPTIESREAPS